MYRRVSIPVLDLSSGKVMDLGRQTPTLDIPADFDREACVATVDARSQTHYLSTNGRTVASIAPLRPLSWRVRGEECLIARTRGGEAKYLLCAVDPSSVG